MILMGAGVNHWFHSDQIYRAMLVLTTITGCQGRNGGGWAHYVGPGEDPPDHGLPAHGLRAGLAPPAAAHEPDGVLVREHQPVPLRHLHRRRPRRRHRRLRRQDGDGPAGPVGAARAGPRATRPSTAAACALADDAEAAGMEAPAYVAAGAQGGRPEVRGRGPRGARTTTRASCRCGAPTCSAPRRRATSTSCATCSAPTAPPTAVEAPPDKRPRDVVWPDEAAEGTPRPAHDDRLPDDQLDDLHRRRAARGHLVREARPRRPPTCTPSSTPSTPAIAPPWQTKSDWDAWKVDREEVLRARGRPPRHPQGRRRQAAVARHPRGDGDRARGGQGLEAHRRRCDPVPGKTMPVIAVVERDYTAVFEKMTSIGPLLEKVGMLTKGVRVRRQARGRHPPHAQRRGARGRR